MPARQVENIANHGC